MRIKDTNIQSAIGWILRAGVILSVATVIFGGLIYLYRNGYKPTDYKTFKGIPDFVKLGGIVDGVLNFRGRAIIQAGIVLLIATPVVRIIMAALGFILEKDHLYTFITLLVLAVIVISTVSGYAG